MRPAKPAWSSNAKVSPWREWTNRNPADEFLEKLVAVNRDGESRQGRPAVRLHGAHRRGRRRRPGRLRLRQGARSAGRHLEGDGAGAQEHDQRQPAQRHAALRGQGRTRGYSRATCSPPADGTGVIAGGGMRAVLECAGVRNVLAKSYGSRNPINVVRATINALAKRALARRHRGQARQDSRRDPGSRRMSDGQLKVTLVRSQARPARAHSRVRARPRPAPDRTRPSR